MNISNIKIIPSSLNEKPWKLSVEANGLTYNGWFDDFGGLLAAIHDAATFFDSRIGFKATNGTALRGEE